MLVRQLTAVSGELSPPAAASSLSSSNSLSTGAVPSPTTAATPGADVTMMEAGPPGMQGGTDAGPSFAELTATLSAHWSLGKFVGPDA